MIEKLKQEVKRIKTDILENVNKIPGQVQTMMTDNFSINGHAITANQVQEMVTELGNQLKDTFQTAATTNKNNTNNDIDVNIVNSNDITYAMFT
jgi:hypothetical protein